MLEKIINSINEIINNDKAMVDGLKLSYELENDDFYNALYTFANIKNPFEFRDKEFLVNFGVEYELLIKFIKKDA